MSGSIIPRNLDGQDFLQPAHCAYADDLAVAASSFRDLMTMLAPAFRSVGWTQVELSEMQLGVIW